MILSGGRRDQEEGEVDGESIAGWIALYSTFKVAQSALQGNG